MTDLVQDLAQGWRELRLSELDRALRISDVARGIQPDADGTVTIPMFTGANS